MFFVIQIVVMKIHRIGLEQDMVCTSTSHINRIMLLSFEVYLRRSNKRVVISNGIIAVYNKHRVLTLFGEQNVKYFESKLMPSAEIFSPSGHKGKIYQFFESNKGKRYWRI